LDAENIERVNRVVDEVCRSTRTSLIYVTHHEAEVPDCVTCILRLKSGRQTKESA
jgi:ABC-type molybdenum transport system ATPase subunit/photorepair protein PhrA